MMVLEFEFDTLGGLLIAKEGAGLPVSMMSWMNDDDDDGVLQKLVPDYYSCFC